MALIGEFEVAVKQADPNVEPDQFRLQGETFTVSERDLTIVFGTFARAATSGLDTAEMEGMAAMIDMLEGVVIDEDKPRLIGLAKKVGLDGELLMEIVKAVIESRTGRPTVQPSDSSDGLPTTGESSKDSSSTEASSLPGEEWRDSTLGRRELAANPDAYKNVKPINQAALSALAG